MYTYTYVHAFELQVAFVIKKYDEVQFYKLTNSIFLFESGFLCIFFIL